MPGIPLAGKLMVVPPERIGGPSPQTAIVVCLRKEVKRNFSWRSKTPGRGGFGRGCFQGDCGGRQAFGLGGESDVALGCGGAEDCDGVAFEEPAVFVGRGGLEGVVVEE